MTTAINNTTTLVLCATLLVNLVDLFDPDMEDLPVGANGEELHLTVEQTIVDGINSSHEATAGTYYRRPLVCFESIYRDGKVTSEFNSYRNPAGVTVNLDQPVAFEAVVTEVQVDVEAQRGGWTRQICQKTIPWSSVAPHITMIDRMSYRQLRHLLFGTTL